jgi:hypothetical protein
LGEEKYVNVLKLILRVIKGIIDNPNDEKKRSVKLGKSAATCTMFCLDPKRRFAEKFKEKTYSYGAVPNVMIKLGFSEVRFSGCSTWGPS